MSPEGSLYAMKSYSYVRLHLQSAVLMAAMAVALLSVASCHSRGSGSQSVYRIERNITAHPDSVLSYISVLTPSVIDGISVGEAHTPYCLSVLCRYKAAYDLSACCDDSARYWLDRADSLMYADAMVKAGDRVRSWDAMRQRTNIREWMAQSTAYTNMGTEAADTVFLQKADSLQRLAVAMLLASARSTDGISHAVSPIRHLYLYISLLIVLLLLLLWYKHREEQKCVAMQRREEQEKIVRRLFDTISERETENQRLQQKIQENQQMRADHIGRGHAIYEEVRKGGTMKNISIGDERSFVDYFAFAFPSLYQQLLQSYTSLSLRHTTYLILCSMHFTPAQIERILFVQPSTLRNYRLRIKQKRRCSE